MGVGNLRMHDSEGRVRGHYVYMLLCDDGDAFYVKVGISSSPIERAGQIQVGCPMEIRQLAFIQVRPKVRARRIEAALHEAFADRRVNGEWFKFQPDEREQFARLRRTVLEEFERDSERLRFQQISMDELNKDARRRRGYVRLIYAKRGKAYHDFVTDQ